jgi:hypothetical protein
VSRFPITIAYDFGLMRAGCAIVQAALGGTIGTQDLMRFEDWLLHPTENMRLATLRSQAELDAAIALTNKEVTA